MTPRSRDPRGRQVASSRLVALAPAAAAAAGTTGADEDEEEIAVVAESAFAVRAIHARHTCGRVAFPALDEEGRPLDT